MNYLFLVTFMKIMFNVSSMDMIFGYEVQKCMQFLRMKLSPENFKYGKRFLLCLNFEIRNLQECLMNHLEPRLRQNCDEKHFTSQNILLLLSVGPVTYFGEGGGFAEVCGKTWLLMAQAYGC
ncbi:MAG: hypothetical protein MHMPM18_002932 [Marteilia pararefringens]